MKSQTIIITLVVLVVLAVLFVFGYSNNGATRASVGAIAESHDSKSSLTTSEAIYDFGTISMKNGNVSKEFKVTNSTDKDIMVKTILTSCMCTTAFIVGFDGSEKGPFGMAGMGYMPPADEIIKAGESRAIRVVYDPNAHGPAGIGAIDRFVTLSDSEGGALQLEIKASVTP